MNKLTKSRLVLAVGGLMLVGAAAAQTQNSNTSGAGPGQFDLGHPRVNEVNARETAQQDRTANGVKNGTLTPGQTSRLENREQNIENSRKPIWPSQRSPDQGRAEAAQQGAEPREQADL